jgi:hypothetical protein
VRAYRKALTASRRTVFYLESSIQQLEILKSLEIRPEYVSAGIKILKEELARIHKEEYDEESEDVEDVDDHLHTGRVFLFAGYKINSGVEKGCFPADMEENIIAEIKQLLDKYNVDSNDLAITAGMAAGGDLLFLEACAARGIPVETHMPVPEPAYVRDFVSPAGDSWVERFYRVRNHPHVNEYYQADLVGDPKADDDVFERNNRWALYSAMVRGVDNLRLIALYDDKLGNGHDALDAQLVKHMIDLMRDGGGQVEIINPSKLTPFESDGQLQKNRPAAEKKAKPKGKLHEKEKPQKPE